MFISSSDKEHIGLYCTRLNELLNQMEKCSLDNLLQWLDQLDDLSQLSTHTDRSSMAPEMLLSVQKMSKGFVHLLHRLKDQSIHSQKDIQSLKEHCHVLTEQFRRLSTESVETTSLSNPSSRVQVTRHPQSAFKPIRPEQD